jgi:dTDP-4-amino-4,6-dideoxygalactose transaminase
MKVLFNDIFKSSHFNNYIDDLWSDYNHFRSKKYSNFCLDILSKHFINSKLYLTHSATGALEIIAKAIDIQPGDEIIMPSFTFVSTANAFVTHGATPVFVDISDDDFNIDITEVEKNIRTNTKAIVVTHYGGHATDLNCLRNLCDQYNLFLIEDAAMGYGNSYGEKPLGTIGHFGVISFDITKQISAVQGGLLLVNDFYDKERIDNIYHIGTNRSSFENHSKPYYEWVDVGAKYQMNEQNALVLYDNLENELYILNRRKEISRWYAEELFEFPDQIMSIHKISFNIHLYYWLSSSLKERESLRLLLHKNGVEAMFHYIPLHSSLMGKKFGNKILPITEIISESLLRLPMHVNLKREDVKYTCELIKNYIQDGREV